MAPIEIDADNLLAMVRQIQSTANQFEGEMNRQVAAVEGLPNFQGRAADAYRVAMGDAGRDFHKVTAAINGLAAQLKTLSDGITQADEALSRIAGGAGTDGRL